MAVSGSLPATRQPSAPAPTVVTALTPGQIFWRRFRKDHLAIAGGVFIVLLIVAPVGAGLVVQLFVHHPPNRLYLYQGTSSVGLPKGPNRDFLFGFDLVGRDLFVRVLYGARTSLIVAFVATGASVAIGVVLGLLAGYRRGFVDTLVTRGIDVMMALPILLLALGLTTVCGVSAKGCAGGLIKPGLPLVILIIALANWTYIARIVRGETLSLRQRRFTEAAESLGASDLRIMFREILPNLALPIIVYSTLVIPNNILLEASLSFLGAGVSSSTPSWGRMISEATANGAYTYAWWVMVFPGLFLFLTTLAFNLLGDGLRDALDPVTAK